MSLAIMDGVEHKPEMKSIYGLDDCFYWQVHCSCGWRSSIKYYRERPIAEFREHNPSFKGDSFDV